MTGRVLFQCWAPHTRRPISVRRRSPGLPCDSTISYWRRPLGPIRFVDCLPNPSDHRKYIYIYVILNLVKYIFQSQCILSEIIENVLRIVGDMALQHISIDKHFLCQFYHLTAFKLFPLKVIMHILFRHRKSINFNVLFTRFAKIQPVTTTITHRLASLRTATS